MMIDRRTLMLAGSGLLVGSTAAFSARVPPPGPQGTVVPLWPDVPPGGGGPDGPIATDRKDAISNIAVPALEVFQPARPNGAAMLVAVGGGYKRIEMGTEARPAARWLAARGITAFALRPLPPAR